MTLESAVGPSVVVVNQEEVRVKEEKNEDFGAFDKKGHQKLSTDETQIFLEKLRLKVKKSQKSGAKSGKKGREN